MASLTTTDGVEVDFSADAVAAVADHDADTGDAFACDWGPTAAVLKTLEGAVAFMARIDIAAKMAVLSRPDRSPVWISRKAVQSLQPPIPGDYPDDVRVVVALVCLNQAVTQDMATAKALVNAKGANL